MVASHERFGKQGVPETGPHRLGSCEAQLLRRLVNEHITSVAGDSRGSGEVELVCECTRPGCWELLTLAPALYEEIRRFPTRFLSKLGHEDPCAERGVGEGPGFVIVEKLGSDAQLAIRSDPRREVASCS
jgi:hypothetical protein